MKLHARWIVAAVCLLAFMNTAGVAMPYPILAPIFVGGPSDNFTHWLGADPQVLMGLALAANPLGILVGSLFAGPLSDRYGRRAILTVMLVASLASYLFTAAALGARDYPLFVLARFVTGLSEGNIAVARALLADLHESFDRARSFAWLNACTYAGWLLGPLVGGLTLPYGEAVPFLLAAAMMVPCLVVLAAGLPRQDASHGPLALLAALREKNLLGLLLADRALAAVAAMQLAYTLGINALYEYAPLWLVNYAGLGSRGIAFVTATQCSVMTLASVLAARFGSQGPGPATLRRAGRVALAAAVGLALLAVLPGPAGIPVIVAMGLTSALYNALLPAWVSERYAHHGQGRVMGLLSTVFCVANVVVALAGGILALASARWIMALGGAACGVAALLTLRLARAESLRPAVAGAGDGRRHRGRRHIMTNTPDRLLHQLKSRGPQGAATLAAGIAITPMGAHKQLQALHAQGLVAFHDEAGAPGRPRRIWSLTAAGHARFPDRHGDLAVSLLRHTVVELGPDALERLILARERECAVTYASALQGARTLGERVRRLAAIRAREGYMARAQREGRDWLLIEDHCPICAAAATCQGFCRSELALFAQVLGPQARIERTEHLLAGARRCAYRIRPTPSGAAQTCKMPA